MTTAPALVLTLWAVLASGPAAPPPLSLPLDGVWRFRAGDDPAWAAPALPDAGWTRVRVPGEWERVAPGYDGYAWYRVWVQLPATLAEGPLGLRLGAVGDAVEAFWNGVPIGRRGSFPPRFVEGVTPAVMLVPNAALRAGDGDGHVLSLRVYDDYASGGLLGGARVGRYDVLADLDRQREMMIGAMVVLFIAIGLYHVAFFLRQPGGRENLYFALLCALAALYGATFSTTFAELVTGEVDPYRVRLLAMLAAGPVYLGLVARLFGLRVERGGQVAVVLCAIGLLAVSALPLAVVTHLHRGVSAGVGLGLASSLVWVLRHARERRRRLWLLVAGMGALSLAVGWDLLSEHAPVLPAAEALPGVPGLFWLGFVAFLVAVGLETAGSFALAEVHARTDPLTRLARRHVFEEALAREAERCRRGGGALTLAVLDLDRFKQINDTYGHRAGDAVLERVGHLLRHGTRNIDLAARLGGEEFAVLLSDTDAEGARIFADRFRHRLRALEVSVPGGVIREMTVSVGIAVGSGWTATDLLVDLADRAMYRAKQTGRDGVVVVRAPDAGGVPSA